MNLRLVSFVTWTIEQFAHLIHKSPLHADFFVTRTGTAAAVERLMNVKQHCLSFPGLSRASQLISTSHVQRGMFHVELGYNMFVDHLLIGMRPWDMNQYEVVASWKTERQLGCYFLPNRC